MSTSRSRRRALQAIAGAAATTPGLAQQPPRQQKPPEHKHDGMVHITPPPVYKLRFFTQEEFETIEVLADIIIPRTDTPGARDAKVHEIIDAGVRPARREAWRQGLQLMDKLAMDGEGRPFRQASASKQLAIVTEASRNPKSDGGRFFKLLKDATVDAYYSTKEGLVAELGWNGNTFLPEFKGCTHPEHQG
ncbi:MAG TPA: gluconate 2-dehydrogenase subunit 3 family protein [Bryobacteraceae bacterium]|nr:gluconate 2-dehydrogenase subunit 3 family protein [Bryobacteraceae bacterium]